MNTKNNTILLIIGAFILGIAFYWLLNSVSDSNNPTKSDNTLVKTTDTENDATLDVSDIAESKTLDLSNQGLDKLPASVLTRTDLEELNISNNNLTGALPSEIGKLKQLKVLNASNNSMTGVPAEVGQLSDLEVLDLSNNSLTGLPYELGNLKKLKILDLSGNAYAEQDLTIIKQGLPADVTIIVD